MESKRNTVQRRLILDAVKELDVHATAEQVYAHIFQEHPTVSKATVYRNLNQMAESGELLNIGSFDGSTHYDHNCHAHGHFMCEACKRIFDVEGDLSSFFAGLRHAEGLVITSCNVSFYGLCGDCKGHRNAAPKM